MTRYVIAVLLCFCGTGVIPQDLGNTEEELLDSVLTPSPILDEQQQRRVDLIENYRSQDPQPMYDGNRLTYLFGVGQPSLICAPLRVCTIVLARGERIADNGILLGDPTRWNLEQALVTSNDAVHLTFKPSDAGIKTNLSILTDGKKARHYHIELISDRDAYMPVVAFRYEAQALEDINSMVAKAQGTRQPNSASHDDAAQLPFDYGEVSIKDLNFDYDIRGCRDCLWRPQRVFDDGTRTIIVLSEDASARPLPAFFVVGTESDAQVSNYRFEDRSYIVDQLFDEARLSLGVGRGHREILIRRKHR